ncbi:DUF7619 domain-containing protein [Neolewinella persica]|uniref:DUF7619 domain-containing protein n=1 Tax=Neolewinella persica TaxID=70998 RepID=UPI00036DD101|nr:T9SS type A sorting domain-containing protein [Neolewinella persica]
MNSITRFTLLVCLLISSLSLTGQSVEGIDFEVGVHDLNTDFRFAYDPDQVLESEDGAFILYDRFLNDFSDKLFYFDGINWERILPDLVGQIQLIQAFQNGIIIEVIDTQYEYWLIDEDSFSKTLLFQSSRRSFYDRVPFLNKLIFKDRDNLYITDGTTGGTQLLSPELEAFQGSNSITMFTDSLFVFFGEDKVYVSDGTASGTRTIYDEVFSLDQSYGLYNVDKKVVFKDWSELISCDLSGICDTVLTPSENDVFFYHDPVRLGEQLMLPINSNQFGLEWWRTDGTVEGSYMISDLLPGDENGLRSLPNREYPVLADQLYFYGRTGDTDGIFATDGTQDGITLMVDLAEFPNRREFATGFDLLGSSADGSEVYFQISLTDEVKHEIWGIGGSAGATPVFISSLPGFPSSVDNISSGIGGVYFSQTNFNTPLEHAVVYGLIDPNEPINTIDSFDYVPEFWLEEADRLYFLGRPVDGANDVPLRSSGLDGTSAKTYQGIFPMSSFFTIDNEVYFINDDSIVNESVYHLNASEDALQKIIDIFPNNDGSNFSSIIKENDLFYILQSGNILATSGNDDFTTIYSGDLTLLEAIAKTATKTLFYVLDDGFIMTDGTVQGTTNVGPFTEFRTDRSAIVSFKDDFYYTTSEIINDQTTKQSLIRLDAGTGLTDTVFFSSFDEPIYESDLQIAATEDHLFFSESFERMNGANKNSIKVYNATSVTDLPNNEFAGMFFERFFEGQLYTIDNSLIIEKFNGAASSIHLVGEDLGSSQLIWEGAAGLYPKFSFIADEAIYGLQSRKLVKSVPVNLSEPEIVILSENVHYGPSKFNEELFVYITRQTGEDYQIKVSNGTPNSPFQEEVFLDQNIPQWTLHNGSIVFLKNDSLFSYSVASDRTTSYTFPESHLVNFNLLPELNNSIYFTADNILLGNEIHYLDFNIFQSTSGLTYHDANQNNQPDPEEALLTNIPVIAQGATSQTTFSNQEGRFSHFLRPEQSYTVSVLTDPCWELSTTPESYAINTVQDSIYNLNFGFQPIQGAASIRPLLSMARPRCAFTIPAWITLYNDGCKDLEHTFAEITLPEGVTLVSADSPPTIVGNALSWEPGALATGESHVIHLELKMPGEEANGEEITINLHSSGIYDADIFTESNFLFSQPLSCAIDPNDKQVTPSRADTTNSNYTQNDETLTYTIRFQNTGTDTAFNVRLEDQLSNQLDHLTFKPIAASHDYRASMDEKGLVKVFFDNIMLPDSNTNQTLSNGYFTFDVNARPGLEDFTTINNTVGIFFDFNQPVITNTVTSTIVEFIDEDEDGFPFYEECDDKNPDIRPDAVEIRGNGIDENCDGSDFPVSSINQLSGQLSVFPNPAHQQLSLTFSDNRELVAQLYDLLGREHTKIVFRNSASLSLGKLPAGTYLLKVSDTQKGETTVQRVIRR